MKSFDEWEIALMEQTKINFNDHIYMHNNYINMHNNLINIGITVE